VVESRRLAAISGSACAWLVATRCFAHDAVVPAARLDAWTPTPWLWLGLCVCAALFARGDVVRARRLGATSRRAWLQRAYFAATLATLVLALLSPLDAWSDRLFAAHMVQHELLMLVAAPLLVLARPLELYFWALPESARPRVITLVRKPWFAYPFGVLTAPGVALLVHGAVRWLWHIPALFEACLRSEWLHGVQHASFFVTAVMFWWSLLYGEHGRLGYGAAVLFVFATALHTGALGALIALSNHPWYPTQTQPLSTFGLDAVHDQQLAGFIMWIATGIWLTGLGLGLFVVWLGQIGRSQRRARWRARALTAARP
jgi:putative membrane protein